MKLIGPFKQIITLRNLALKGPLKDESLEIIRDGGILVEDGKIKTIGSFEVLREENRDFIKTIEELQSPQVAIPGLVDMHTHICFAGTRSRDYAMRNAGKTYLEIAKEGGGIMDTVNATREATREELEELTLSRVKRHISNGVTTMEVKSGYGLTIGQEIKMLKVIEDVIPKTSASIIPTCLAAHIFPKDYDGTVQEYLSEIIENLFPVLKSEKLCNRIDAFIEEEAFNAKNIAPYFEAAQKMGFDITVHADQFHAGGTEVAVKYNALSADHLEASGEKEITLLAKSNVVAVALPGATLGLGCAFTPARKLLDAGCSLAIASDWNPGSGPMGDLVTSASILQTFQKLSTAEVLSGMTYRAAAALKLRDRGTLDNGMKADFISYSVDDYREILYQQGQLKPENVWVDGKTV